MYNPKVNEKIEFYLPKKVKGEMDFSQIKDELKAEEFSHDEISSIIREISDRELEEVGANARGLLDFTSTPAFSVVFILIAIAVIVFCIVVIVMGYENRFFKYAPHVFLAGGLVLLIRHISRLVVYINNKNRNRNEL